MEDPAVLDALEEQREQLNIAYQGNKMKCPKCLDHSLFFQAAIPFRENRAEGFRFCRSADRQLPIRINYKGLDGYGSVKIPPELVGHPALSPLIPPNSIQRLQTLIDTIDRYRVASGKE